MTEAYDPLTALHPGAGLAHVPSYWAATVGELPPDDGPAPAAVDAEIVIVGGGYTGLACAYHLAQTYGVRPVVLEANRAGWGCSGRNGGFARMALGRFSAAESISKWGKPAAARAFEITRDSLNHVRGLIASGHIDCDASEAGHLKIAHRASRVAGLKHEAGLLQREFNYPAEFIDGGQLRKIHLGGTQSYGALRIPDALAIHPLKLAMGLLRMARAAGATVHTGTPVLNIGKRGAQHELTTPHGIVRAKTLVLATNGYTPPALHRALASTLLPALSHIIVTRPLTQSEIDGANFQTRHVLTDTRKLLYYWRRLPDNRILFGGRGLITESPAHNTAQRDFLLAELRAKYPALANVTVDYDWHGWVCVTRDFLPHVHHAADDRSVHYAVGYQGSGVAMSLYAGKLLAQNIFGETVLKDLPQVASPLARYPLHDLVRIPQRVMYAWYKHLDRSD